MAKVPNGFKKIAVCGDDAFVIYEGSSQLLVQKSGEEPISIVLFFVVVVPLALAMGLGCGALAIWILVFAETWWGKTAGSALLFVGSAFCLWVLWRFAVAVLPGEVRLNRLPDGDVLYKFSIWHFGFRRKVCRPPFDVIMSSTYARGDWGYKVELACAEGRHTLCIPTIAGTRTRAKREADMIGSAVASFVGATVTMKGWGKEEP